MAQAASKSTVRILTLAFAIPVSLASRRLVASIWSTVRPDAQERRNSPAGATWKDMVGWAALSSVGAVATELISRRSAESIYRLLVGSTPPSLVSRQRRRAEKRGAKARAKVSISED